LTRVAFDDVENWWTNIALAHGSQRKGIASLLMLVTWELWKERNARTFNNIGIFPTIIFDNIKTEARTWVLAGAKHLDTLNSGGLAFSFDVDFFFARTCIQTSP
jgi:hypothetical protein